MALSDEYDDQAINGDGQSPNVNGLINQLTNPADPTNVADFDALVAAFADQIDGLWASRIREVSIVANVDAYKLAAKKFRDRPSTPGTGAASAWATPRSRDYAQMKTGGFWTNKRMPATASNIARSIVYRMVPDGAADRVSPDLGHHLDGRHLYKEVDPLSLNPRKGPVYIGLNGRSSAHRQPS